MKNRTKGTGSIFKRGKTFYLQYMLNGKLKKISLQCTSKKAAEKKVKEILVPLQTADTKEKIAVHIAEARNIVKRGKAPLKKVWELYLSNPSRPDSGSGTLKNYEGQWKRFKKWLLNEYPNITTLNGVSDDIASEYADYLWGSGLSAKTYNNHIKALMLIFRILSSVAGLNQNPWHCISRKVETKQSKKEFTEEDVLRILDSLNNPKLHLKNREEMTVLFHLGAWTGLRFIDCVMMKWGNIDFDRNLIVDCKPQKTARKTNKTVTIPMHPLLRQFIEKAHKWKENDYVLPKVAKRYDENSSYVSNIAISIFKFNGFKTSKKIKGVQRKIKANVYGFHSFRHSFVSFCAKAGVPLPVVQSIVGHGNPAITRHYIHIGEDSVKQAINALPQGKALLKVSNEKTSDDKIKEVLGLLNTKKKLTKTDKQIMEIINQTTE
jgi:integrase